MDILVVPLLHIVLAFLRLYHFLVLAYVILSWLESFEIVNRYNQVVYNIHNVLFRLVEPALRPLRRFIPYVGGLDLSPLLLLFAIYFIELVLSRILVRFPL